MLSDAISDYLNKGITLNEFKDWTEHYKLENSLFRYDERLLGLVDRSISGIDLGTHKNEHEAVLKDVLYVLDSPRSPIFTTDWLFLKYNLAAKDSV